ncbi:variable surface protein [Plasmodium gonderi]|uniref:Variable surface protein n=1 Tax=Plasmodium gonderi TaxID=77519 RepID=A0A1Y1JQ92_PLAGO|nr:variable surface protein [Plasmodium gonderi]GAW84380.1 variable surface protein [Plasmodium gonderi]
MGIMDYSLVKKFNEIQKKIEDYVREGGGVQCSIKTLGMDHIKDNFNPNQCNKALLCVSYMDYIKTKGEFTYEDYLYMYYSIYNNLRENGYRSEIHIICNALINASGYGNNGICNDFNSVGITYIELEKIKNLYNMHNSLENIKTHYCKSNENDDFCKTAKDVIDEYYPTKHDPSCQEVIYKVPVTHHKNISIPILVTIITMLIMSILLFILFKLSPYGSYLVRMLRSIKNMFNNINEERNEVEASEISGIIWNDNNYNVLYNCD